MEELLLEILEELQIELEVTEDSDVAILSLKIKNAIREVKSAFNFKKSHTDDFIRIELEKHISNIKNLAIYDYMKIGAEGESSHNEKYISRQYVDRNSCFAGIVPYAD